MNAAMPLLRYARDLLGLGNAGDILARTCLQVSLTAGSARAYGAAQLQQHQAWETAELVAMQGRDRLASTVEIRSALFALQRRVSSRRGGVDLQRNAETRALFEALAPGAEGTALLHALPLLDRTGRVIGTLAAVLELEQLEGGLRGLLVDIAALAMSAMENAQRLRLARRDQERLLLLAETADEALWDWSLSRGEVWWGGGIEALFGAGGVLISNRPSWRVDRMHPEDRAAVCESFEVTLASTLSAWSEEYRFERADGTYIHVRDRAYFLRDADGRAYRVIGMLRDMTSLRELLEREKLARSEAERASAVKDEFLAMLGHELRNPLAPIVSALKLLEQRHGGLHDRQLQVIDRQTQHLVRLVDDLLDISRITRGKIELARRPVPVKQLVARAMEMAAPLIEQKRHRVEVDVEELSVDADPARIAQVLANLVNNAAKYTEPGGTLWISARRVGAQAELAVRDNGIGISPEVLPRVFDMFVQARQAIDRAQGGLGLGLSIVKNLVSLHGGTVEAKSEGQGQGSTLVVRLPLAASAAAEARDEAPAPPPEQRSHVRTLKVLLVDDNEDAATLLGEVLEELGFQVFIANDGAAGLRLAEAQQPDLGVLDIGLPVMDGYELARRLRERFGAGLKLIALTGYGQASDKRRAQEASFDAHLVKPVDVDKLESLIRKLVAAADAPTALAG